MVTHLTVVWTHKSVLINTIFLTVYHYSYYKKMTLSCVIIIKGKSYHYLSEFIHYMYTACACKRYK